MPLVEGRPENLPLGAPPSYSKLPLPVGRWWRLISIFVTQVHTEDQVENWEAFNAGPHRGNLVYCYLIQPRYQGREAARVINSKRNRNVCTYVNGNKSNSNVALRDKCLVATCPIDIGQELLLKYPYSPVAERKAVSGGEKLPEPMFRVPKVSTNVEVKFDKRIVRIATFDRALRIRRI